METKEKLTQIYESLKLGRRKTAIDSLLNNGICYCGLYEGTGRHTKAVDFSDDIKSLLRDANIRHAWGNDAPRGGVTGQFVMIDDKSFLRSIGRSRLIEKLDDIAIFNKWQKPKKWTEDELLECATEAIDWCDEKDEADEDGRYWLSIYHGCGVYELIVQNGKIIGGIHGGFGNSVPRKLGKEEVTRQQWMNTLQKVLVSRIGEHFDFVKADGSGTYFYARSIDDLEKLSNKRVYSVPSVHGGEHLNIEIR